MVAAARLVEVLDPVEVAVPPPVAEVVGELVPALGEDVLDQVAGVDVARERAVEVEQHGAGACRHRHEVYGRPRSAFRASSAQGGCGDLRQLDVDNVLLVAVWAIAAAVTIGATVIALRANRRARRAAALVAQLLEPAVLVDDPGLEGLAAPDDADDPLDPLDPLEAGIPPAPITEAAVFAAAAPPGSTEPSPDPVADPAASTSSGDRDPGQTRIPVFDLERLRWWLTDGEVALGRIAVVSVELDNLSLVNERHGYRAGAQLLEAITTRLRAVTRPRDVVAHVNPERFVLVCRDVPDRAAAEALAERISMGVAHPSLVGEGSPR